MTNFDFMKTAKWWVLLSVIVTVVGVGSLLTQGLNKSIDFTGGAEVDVTLSKAGATSKQVEDLVKNVSKTEAVAQQDAQNANAFIVRTGFLDAKQQGEMKTAFDSVGGASVSVATVDAAVSRELTTQAILAVAVASLLQIIYITIRFEYKFAITAVIAVLHDALITLGLMSLFQAQVGAPFVAAVLTLTGYSINDTVVVFDRIRENLRVRKKGETLHELVNRSVNQVWQRSLMAAFTVLISILAVFLFGGHTVHDFALALLIGIVTGGYSSIFIASALWLWWKNWEAKAKVSGAAKPV